MGAVGCSIEYNGRPLPSNAIIRCAVSHFSFNNLISSFSHNVRREFSLPNYVVGGPGGGPVQVWNASDNDYSIIWVGPETYRPSFNAYMIANSRAISTVAQLAGNNSLAQQWNTTSATLYSNMQKVLWNDEIQFWIDVVAQSNVPAVGRELIGYYPFRFDIGTDDQYVKGLETGLTSEGFLTDFGPTTLEQSNEYYTAMKNLSYCCVSICLST